MRLTVLFFSRLNGFGLKFWNIMRKRDHSV